MIILCIVFLYIHFCDLKMVPQWPKHVVSIINRIQDSCVLTYPAPSLRYEGYHHCENRGTQWAWGRFKERYSVLIGKYGVSLYDAP